MIHPLDDNIGFVSMVDRMSQDPLLKTVNSARLSLDRHKVALDDKDKRLLDYLWQNGHTSPYRHSYFTFHIKAPLFVFRQWVKYQVGGGWRKFEVNGDPVSIEAFDCMFDTDKGCSWNEQSGRYTEFKPEFFVPTKARVNNGRQSSVVANSDILDSALIAYVRGATDTALHAYRFMLEVGISKEQARMILPQNIYTQAYWTVSYQGLLHFFEQRCKPEAQEEIRLYAEAVKRLVDAALAAPTTEHP